MLDQNTNIDAGILDESYGWWVIITYKLLMITLTLMALSQAAHRNNNISQDNLQEIDAADVCEKIQSGEPIEYDHIIIHGDLGLPFRFEEKYAPRNYLNTTSIRITAPIKITNSRINGTVYFKGFIFESTVDFSYTSFDEELVGLTPIEYRLLATLIHDMGKVLTHRQLLREVWGPGHAEDSHYLRIYMGQLRRKLETDPARPRFLQNEPGVGYRLKIEPNES